MSDNDVSPQQVLEEGMRGHDELDQHVASAAIVIVESIGPDGDQFLSHRRDTHSGTWKHIGMLESMLVDLKETWRRVASEDDDDA